jgi:hypothetical protein
MVQAGNLEIKRRGGSKERGRCLLCTEHESEYHLLLKFPENRGGERSS